MIKHTQTSSNHYSFIRSFLNQTILITTLYLVAFQDGLLQQCIAVMKETINSKSVCDYYDKAGLYGQIDVQKACLTWLEQNIMASNNTDLIRKIK